MDDSPFVRSDTRVPHFAPGSPVPNWLLMGLTGPGIDFQLVKENRRNITPYLHLRGLRAEVVRCLAYPQSFGVPWDGRWVEVAVLQGRLTDEQAARLVGYAVGCLWDQKNPSRPLPLAVLGPWRQEEGCEQEPWYDSTWDRPTLLGSWNYHHMMYDCGESDADQVLWGKTATDGIYDDSGEYDYEHDRIVRLPKVLVEPVFRFTYPARPKSVAECKEHTDRLGFELGAVLWEQITTESDERQLAAIRAGRRQF